MITRDQFEVHVRAEAKEKYPTQEAEREVDRTLFAMLNNEQKMRQGAYIAARMEHEWPLVEAAQALVDRWDTPLWKDVPHTGEFIGKPREALYPYTTRAAQ